jgi:hypothetical protein
LVEAAAAMNADNLRFTTEMTDKSASEAKRLI